jgi:hypothetical protein
VNHAIAKGDIWPPSSDWCPAKRAGHGQNPRWGPAAPHGCPPPLGAFRARLANRKHAVAGAAESASIRATRAAHRSAPDRRSGLARAGLIGTQETAVAGDDRAIKAASVDFFADSRDEFAEERAPQIATAAANWARLSKVELSRPPCEDGAPTSNPHCISTDRLKPEGGARCRGSST